MGKYQGVKEKLHYPVYDAFFVPGEPMQKTFMETMTDPRMVRFFVDVQNKTKLETNLQSSGVLPSLNTFEARALRVVVSPCIEGDEESKVVEIADRYCEKVRSTDSAEEQEKARQALRAEMAEECDRSAADKILSELIYNSVTTLLVGEKIMIEMPTYFFPSGAGIFPGGSKISNHGEPDPMATFRFAEPVTIEPQQNFRVEMLFPQGVPKALANVKGAFRIWVVLDGYLTRDVQ
ncbi:MAG: hypothetical protein AAGC93_20290 [Cyanobacteria bacterium P01_F01_bin.53]